MKLKLKLKEVQEVKGDEVARNEGVEVDGSEGGEGLSFCCFSIYVFDLNGCSFIELGKT
jgi:hypothetical protein